MEVNSVEVRNSGGRGGDGKGWQAEYEDIFNSYKQCYSTLG